MDPKHSNNTFMQNLFFHNAIATAAFLLLPLFTFAQQNSDRNTFADHFDGVTTAVSDVITLRRIPRDSNEVIMDTMLFRFIPTDTIPVDTGTEGWKISRVDGTCVGATEVTRSQWLSIMGSEDPTELSRVKHDRGKADLARHCGELPATGMKVADVLRFIDSVALIGAQPVTLLDLESKAATELRNYSDSVDDQGCYYKVPLPFGLHDLRHTAWLRCQTLHPVATKTPDRFGIYDLAGNARELYIIKKAGTNEKSGGNPSQECTYTLILWGGSYCSDEDGIQYLQWDPTKEPDFRLPDDVGIRLAYQQSFFISLK